MSKTDTASQLNAILKRAKAQPADSPAPGDDPVAELVYSFLLWEAPASRARAAYKRITDAVVSHNDLRVTLISDLVELLGKTYPLAVQRAERLHIALEALYAREYKVTLDGALALGKRDGRKYLETIDHMPPFVAGRVALIALGAHAAPVDERLLTRLIEASVFPEGTTADEASASLERAVKAADGLGTHQRLIAWLEEAAPAKPAAGTKSKKKSAKKTTKKAATKKSTSKKASGKKTSKKKTTKKKAGTTKKR